MSNRILADSSFSHIVNAPVEHIDIGGWLSHLTNAEYQRCCPPDHIACGATTTDDGRLMSINVETIGDSLLVQHYIGEIAQPHHCRMVSLSDVFGPLGRTTSHVVWELKVEPFDETRSEYVSHLTATATDELLALLDEHGIAFEQAAAARDEAAAAHNARETPRFAHSIEQRALPRRDRRNPN